MIPGTGWVAVYQGAEGEDGFTLPVVCWDDDINGWVCFKGVTLKADTFLQQPVRWLQTRGTHALNPGSAPSGPSSGVRAGRLDRDRAGDPRRRPVHPCRLREAGWSSRTRGR